MALRRRYSYGRPLVMWCGDATSRNAARIQHLRCTTQEVYCLPGWCVDVTYVRGWLLSLDRRTYEQVVAALELLQEEGPGLGRPLVDTIRGSRHRNLKELRPGSTGHAKVRVVFAFDNRRRAVLLVGGDKAGRWEQWYRVNIPRADALLDVHLESGNEVPENVRDLG